MATLIKPVEGAKALDAVPTFKDCYSLVECKMLEVVRLTNGGILLVGEEGLCCDSPVMNPIASAIAGQVIVGNAVFFNKTEARRVLR